jgi:hypothetical protein
MRIEGTIRPTGKGSRFSRDSWCQLVSARPEFRPYPARQSRNPFTGETMTVQPPADAAEVVLEGRAVGEVYWSMSDEPLVNVSIEPPAMPLVLEWATALGGEYRPDSPSA